MPNIQRERERERVKRVKAGLIVLCLILLVFTVVEASPPGSAYTPGETLAPSCSPGDTNCKVALTSGSVLFSNGTDLITQDNSNFYWDDTNNRLGIGTTTPSYKLTILGDLFVNTSSTLGNVISGVWQGTAIGDSYVSSAATWNAKITTSSLSVAYSPLSYNNATGVFSLPTSTASQSGFLSSADWTTFNSKQNNISFPIGVASTSLTASLPLLLTTNDLSLTGRLSTINSIATSTGSLIAAKADTTGWYGLTVGTDAKVLMASSTAIYGLSWETLALTPAGSNTQIQFNNSGSFLGDANFTWASSTQLLTITGTSTISGNLGIGTTTPSSLLDVAGIVHLRGFATSTTGLYVNGSGNVGIATTTPSSPLTVAGTIESSSGGFKFPDATTQTTAGSNFKVGTFTRDMTAASGNVAYTGVGFQPKAVIFLSQLDNSSAYSSNGFSDGTTERSVYYRPVSGIRTGFNRTQSIALFADEAETTGVTATVSSFDADGFTLAWTKIGSPTGTATINYMAYR